MPRREVHLYLDDKLVEQLDRLATALGTSRSDLLRRGAQAVIIAESDRSSDAELIAGYRSRPPDAVLVRSASRLAARTLPAW